MSRFLSKNHARLTPYTPGEQPKERKYIKLNTNESPFPPSESVFRSAEEASRSLQLYSDPECRELNQKAAQAFGVAPENILMTNGSDEILNFAFMAFGDEDHPFAFPNLTYGFYPVFAKLNHVPFREIPLREDFSIDVKDYENLGMNIVIANPNAPTGLLLGLSDIERIVKTNPENVVVIDEAYIDFGGESAISLIEKYDNLLVTRTFSKSYSLAGARLGFGIAAPSIIADLNTIKYSTNPYNVNRMTAACGIAALEDRAYYMQNCKTIIENRRKAAKALSDLGFFVTDSKANFLFAAHPKMDGKELYLLLKERGILIRHFEIPEIKNFNRITVGTEEEMNCLIEAVKEIQKEVLK